MSPRMQVAVALVGLMGGVVVIYTAVPHAPSRMTAAASKSRTDTPIPVRTTTVQRGTIRHQKTATGDILAAARVEVYSKVEGRLRALRVEVGDSVQAGQIIAQIVDTELRARLERAAAELDALRAAWAQMQAGARPEEIAQAVDRVQQTRAELTNTERLLKRTRALVRRGLRSTQELEDATLRVIQARAAHNTAEKRLQLVRAGARAEDRQALQARLRAARAALRLANPEFQHAVIPAPIPGIVSHRYVDPGAYITYKISLVTIVEMKTVKLKVPISERDIGALRPGLRAHMRVDAYPQAVFEGTVRRVGPTIDPVSRRGEVEIRVANPDYRLKPGMFAKVTIVLEQRQHVVVIPRDALSLNGQGPAVFLGQDGLAYRRQVTTGLHDDTQVEIVDGLTPGAEIVLAGQPSLKDKTPVLVVNAKE